MPKILQKFLCSFLLVSTLMGSSIFAFAADEFGGGSYGGGAGRGDFFAWADGFGGGSFGGGAGRDDSKAAYDAYVSNLPASGYTSDGGLLWHVSVNDILTIKYADMGVAIPISSLPYSSTGYTRDLCVSSSNSFSAMCPAPTYNRTLGTEFTVSASYPLSGLYTRVSSPCLSFRYALEDGSLKHVATSYDTGGCSYHAKDSGFNIFTSYDFGPDVHRTYLAATFYLPVYEVIPDTAPSGDTYNINTRPTSISGGNYGIVGDNGQITKVEGNTIVNETNNTYYNPATGTTSPITGWNYDYSDRSYTVTTESGDTVTVTYGDENITIKEGDTIYNVYYLVDGSGSETPPEACAHEWTETSRTEPTCTIPGKVSSTCSKCQQTKSEPLPALGHTWTVDRIVNTSYDEEGNLVQQGYTIYQCSVCGEQYKDEVGTGPPGGGGSTTDPGEDKETIWDKLANLAGSVLGGLIGMVEAVLGKILDALTALTDMLMERLKTVVETVLSIFEELPKLFGGFLDFLGAVFPFLPPELMTVLTFGIIAVVFIAIIKAVRR